MKAKKKKRKKRLELVTRVINGDTASVKRSNPKIRQRVGQDAFRVLIE